MTNARTRSRMTWFVLSDWERYFSLPSSKVSKEEPKNAPTLIEDYGLYSKLRTNPLQENL